jgi:hypothetical protein
MKRLLICGVIVLVALGLMVGTAQGWGRGYGRGYYGRGWRGGWGPGFGIGLNLGGPVYGPAYPRPAYDGCPSRSYCEQYPDKEICGRCYPQMYR